jgi:hypothetical protein
MNLLGYDYSDDGCGAYSCCIKKPEGQGVNWPCMCLMNIPFCDKIIIRKELDKMKRTPVTDVKLWK